MTDPGPTSERLEALRSRWESDKGSRVFLQLADEYRRLGRAEEAVRALEEGLAENPRYPAAQVALGRCQLELGRVDDAARALEHVIESDPTQMVAYRLLVDVYVAQGKPVEARQRLRVYGLLNDADPDIAELRRKIGQLEREGAPDESSAQPEPEPAASGAPSAPEEEPVAGTPAEPFADLAAPEVPARAGIASDPFPDLAARPMPAGRVAPAGDDLFGLAAPTAPTVAEAEPAAPEPEPLSTQPEPPLDAPAGLPMDAEPFELEGAAPPPMPDLSALLEPGTGESVEPVADEPVPVAEEQAPEPPPPPLPMEEAWERVPDDELEEDEPEEDEPAALPSSISEAGRPTVTLGLLYLRQGHTREAEEIFHAVLERDPDNAEALRHLEEIGDQLRAELGEARRVTAVDLLQGWEGGPREAGTTHRKRYVLERYGERLRGRAPDDVH